MNLSDLPKTWTHYVSNEKVQQVQIEVDLQIEDRLIQGSRVFGPANGSLWWQINEERVGPNRVLLGLVMFIDESYNKKSMSCEAMYGERHTVENFNDHCILLMIAQRSATLLNIDETKRFKKGAYRFWGCIPKYDNAVAKAEGKSDEWIRRRSAEVHRAAMHPVVEQIREVSEARPYLFEDGVTRLAAGRPAIIIGDQPGQEQLLSTATKGCSVCCAPFDELDHTDKEWPLRESSELLQSMQRIAAECLNEAGEVIHGKRQVLADWERDNRMRFGSNAILELIDLGFDALLQLPRCFLHLIVLGLFGHNIIKAIIHLIEITLTKKEYICIRVLTMSRGSLATERRQFRRLQSKVSCRDWPIGGLPPSQTNHALPLQQVSLGISSKWLSRAVLRLLAIA